MRGGRFILALTILLVLLGLGAASVFRVDQSTGIVELPTSNPGAHLPAGPLTLEDAYGSARDVARQHLTQPALMFASLQADWPLDDQSSGPPQFPPGGWARFAFVETGSVEGRLLSVVIERYSGEVVTAELQPWARADVPDLPLTVTPITSQAALLVAEKVYGQAFRLRCPVDRHESEISLVVGTGPSVVASPGTESAATTLPGPNLPAEGATPVPTTVAVGTPVATSSAAPTGAHWLVTYRDGRQPGVNSVEIEIDAATAGVLAIRDQSTGCDTSS